MEIILGDKTYNTAGKSKARMFRVAIELSSRMEKGDITPQDLDDLVGFVCDVYGKQFSVGDVYDGLDSDLLIRCNNRSTIVVIIRVGIKVDFYLFPLQLARYFRRQGFQFRL